MNRPPCKDCEDRKVGCHAECEKYRTYKETRTKECIWLINTNRSQVKPSTCRYRKSSGRYEAPARRRPG